MARNFDLSIRLKAVVEGLQDISRMAEEIEQVGATSDETADQAATLNQQFDALRSTTTAAASFDELERALEETGEELALTRARADGLGREMAQLAQPTDEARQAFDRAQQEVVALERAQAGLGDAAREAGRELDALGGDSRDLAATQERLEREVRETAHGFDELGQAVRQARGDAAREFADPTDRLQRGADSAGASMALLARRIRSTAGLALGSVAAFFGLQEAIRGIARLGGVGSDMEALDTRLKSIMGSIEGGERASAWIKDFTRNTPFQLNEVTEAFIRAKAFGMDPMNGTLQAIADQASQLGGGMETLTGITTALGQAYAKQKLQGEEILQLVERGVPAWDLLAEATGRSVQQLQKMSSAGELGRREIDLLVEAMGGRAAGAAADQMTMLGGIVSNLRDNIREFAEEVNRQGFLDYIKGELTALQRRFEAMRASGELTAWARSISDALVGLGRSVQAVAGFIVEYRDAIVLAGKAWVAYKAAQAGAGLLTMAANLRQRITPAVAALSTATAGATTQMGRLRGAMALIPGPGQIALLAVAAMELPGLFERAGNAIGRLAYQHSDAAQHLEATRARLRQSALQQIADIDDQIAAAERYRAVEAQSHAAVMAMSEAQRTAYAEQLEGLRLLQRLEYETAMLREQAGEDTQARQAELRDALGETRTALAAVAAAELAVQQTADTQLSPAAARLATRFRELRAEGETTATAVAALFEHFTTPGDLTQVETLIQAISQIKGESAEAGAAIEANLAQALQAMSGEELQRFVIALQAAFGQGEEFAGEFAQTARAAADAAFRHLGSSLREFETGISDAERSAIDAFRALDAAGILTGTNLSRAFATLVDEIKSPEAVREIAGLLDELQARGLAVSAEVREAFAAMAEGVQGTAEQIGRDLTDALAEATSQQELSALTERLLTAWREGKIGVDDYIAALAAAQAKHAELAEDAKAKAQTAGEAWRGADEAAGAATQASAAGAEKAGAATERATQAVRRFSQTWQEVLDNAERQGPPAIWGNNANWNRAIRENYTQVLRWAQAQRDAHQASVDARYGIEDLRAALGGTGRTLDSVRERSDALEQELRDMARASGQTVDQLRALDAQSLANLRNEAATLRGEMDALNDSLADTVASLQQQLASLQGDNARAQELRYLEQQAELQAQLDRARDAGDRDAQQRARDAQRLAEQIHQERLRQIREQDAEAKQRDAERMTQAASQAVRGEEQQRDATAVARQQTEAIGRATQTAAASINERTITLNLDAGGQRLGTLSGVDEREAERLLDAIARGQYTAPRY